MKKKKMFFITTLFFGLIFFSSITVSFADEEINSNLLDWFHTQVDQMVNNSVAEIQSKLDLKEEELKKQLEIEKQKAAEDLQTYKEEQLKLYNQQMNEIISAKSANSSEGNRSSVNDQEKNTGQ